MKEKEILWIVCFFRAIRNKHLINLLDSPQNEKECM